MNKFGMYELQSAARDRKADNLNCRVGLCTYMHEYVACILHGDLYELAKECFSDQIFNSLKLCLSGLSDISCSLSENQTDEHD